MCGLVGLCIMVEVMFRFGYCFYTEVTLTLGEAVLSVAVSLTTVLTPGVVLYL